MLDQGCLGSLGRCMAGVAHALTEPPPPQCPFPGDTEEEVFECIVNADAPYPRFLSVQGLELLQKVITAESGAGPDNCRGSRAALSPPALGAPWSSRLGVLGGGGSAWGHVPSGSTCPLAQLLQKCPEKRLGASEQDAEEIKTQPFFRVSGQAYSGRRHLAQWEVLRDMWVAIFCHVVSGASALVPRPLTGRPCSPALSGPPLRPPSVALRTCATSRASSRGCRLP